MAKLRPKSYVFLISMVVFFSGCGYKFITGADRKIFIHPIVNSSTQPLADIYLDRAVRKIFVENAGFSIMNSETAADYALHLSIRKWERSPLLFPADNPKEIVVAKFYIEAEISASKNSENLFVDKVSETFDESLYTEYNEDEVLEKISEKLARKIYFKLIQENEKTGSR